MPRRPSFTKGPPLNLALPIDERARLDLHLFSQVEGRVPHAAYQAFFTARLKDYFESRRLDLAPYLNCPSGSCVVSGTPAVIEQLERVLES